MAEHKAVVVTDFNPQHPAKGCHLMSVRTADPAANQLLLRILCRTVNPVDLILMSGGYVGIVPPKTLGMEAMGVVHKVGENVTEYHVGQRLYYFTNARDSGTWQEYALVTLPCKFPRELSNPQFEMLVPIPDGVPDQVAVQFFGNPFTAYGLLDELKFPQGEYVLQTAAGSVLGRMFIQLAKHMGIKTINLVRRNEQKEELKAIGADLVINFKEEDVVELVRKTTNGKMAYAAVDCVGGELTQVVASSVRVSGTVLVFGKLDKSNKVAAKIDDFLFRDVRLRGFALIRYILKLTEDELQQIGKKIMSLMLNKVLTPTAGEEFPLDQFEAAILKSQEAGTNGKILLTSYVRVPVSI